MAVLGIEAGKRNCTAVAVDDTERKVRRTHHGDHQR